MQRQNVGIITRKRCSRNHSSICFQSFHLRMSVGFCPPPFLSLVLARWGAVGGQRRHCNLDDTNGSISPSQYCPDPNGRNKEGGRKWIVRREGKRKEEAGGGGGGHQRTICSDWFIVIFVADVSKSGATDAIAFSHRRRRRWFNLTQLLLEVQGR